MTIGAELVARMRAILIILLALLMIASQAAPSTYANEAGALPIIGWFLLGVVLLIYIHPLGLLAWSGKIRQGIEDEGTAHNRAAAYCAGFWASLIFAIMLFGMPGLRDMGGREVARIVASATVATAAIRFAIAELRGLYG